MSVRYAGVVLFTILTLGFTEPARAADLVQLNLQSGSESAFRSYSSLPQAIDALTSTGRVQQLIPSYTETSAVTGTARYLDRTIITSYPENSADLTIRIPECGISLTYSGANPADPAASASRKQSRNNLRSNPDGILECLSGPAFSGPGSVGDLAAASDMDAAVTDPGSGFGVGAQFRSFSANGFRSKDFVLPLSYVRRLSASDTLEVNVPVSIMDVQGGKSYSATVGVLWRHRVTPNWTLQPSVRFGGVASVDLGVAAPVWSVGINSVANFDLPGQWQFTLANGLTYFATIPLSIGGYNLDYGVSNLIFRNGVLFSHDLGFRLLNLPTRGSVFAVDTRYAGSAATINNYQELGMFVSAGSVTPARIGATYYRGAHGLNGFMINTGIRF